MAPESALSTIRHRRCHTGVAVEKYFNLDGKSGSWTFKPMLRVPFSGTDDYEIYDNEWGNGLGWVRIRDR